MVKPLEPVQTVGIDTITPYKNNPRDNTKAVGGWRSHFKLTVGSNRS